MRQRLRRPLSTLSCRGGKLANSLLADCGTVRRVFQQNPAITRGDLCETRRRGWPVTPKPAEGTKRRGQMALLGAAGFVDGRPVLSDVILAVGPLNLRNSRSVYGSTQVLSSIVLGMCPTLRALRTKTKGSWGRGPTTNIQYSPARQR